MRSMTTFSWAPGSNSSTPPPVSASPPPLPPSSSSASPSSQAYPAADFDAAYIEDMKQIHDKDEKLFAQEAKDGSGDFKPFAAETDKIVKRHIGALDAG